MGRDLRRVAEDLAAISNRLIAPDRLKHIEGVVRFLLDLASVHGLCAEKVSVMGLAHDLFRDLPSGKLISMAKAYRLQVPPLYFRNPILLHGPVASAFLVARYHLSDEEILRGVRYHTSGAPDLEPHGKALVIADSIEFSRDYEKVDLLRRLAFEDLGLAFREVIRNKIVYAVTNGLLLLPETLETWNKLVEAELSEG